MQKWEYCAVGPIHHSGPAFLIERREVEGFNAELTEFTIQGRKQTLMKRKKGIREHDMLARTIAQLGEEGWELVGCGATVPNTHLLYFKRPKQE